MIFIDSNIPMYIVGADHPNKDSVLSKLPSLVAGGERMVTSAEVFQEIIHRYKAVKDPKGLAAAYEALEAIADEVFSITKLEVDVAKAFCLQYPKLSSRDALHLATMKSHQCFKVWSFDKLFETVPSVTRIE